MQMFLWRAGEQFFSALPNNQKHGIGDGADGCWQAVNRLFERDLMQRLSFQLP
jgi:hypothetical protein